MSRVLITGATGYVGGRLVPRLLEDGHSVRCLVRTPAKLADVAWYGDVTIVRGSIDGPLEAAMTDVDTAVYLVHGIGQSDDWSEKESRDAEHFRLAAETAGVTRIVYLGGMGIDDDALSIHLASRHAVGRTLAAGPIPVTELRAAVIIGSGSASFEMLRYLVEVLPVMVAPKWVSTRSQPIAISDVLDYLVQVIDSPTPLAGVFEIGGPDVVTYAQMMALYAKEAGLKRRHVLVVPFLTPHLSSLWVGLVTPVPGSLARPLVNSLINEVVVRDPRIVDLLGPPQRTLQQAISLALGVSRDQVPTSFTSADLQPFRKYATDPTWSGGTELRDVRVRHSDASVERVLAAVTSLGGEKGWHRGEWLWRVRGFSDLLWGGPGLRRGRRHPHELHVGDYVDFWRVEALGTAPHLVRLHAEMVLPGEAWLQWTVTSNGPGATVTQEALFKPRGLLGRVYWYAVAPFHVLVFPGLLKGIIADAEVPTPGA